MINNLPEIEASGKTLGRFVVKIQLPQGSYISRTEALIYNEDRSVEYLTDDPQMHACLVRAMNGRMSAFFYATIDQEDAIVLEEEAPDQDW